MSAASLAGLLSNIEHEHYDDCEAEHEHEGLPCRSVLAEVWEPESSSSFVATKMTSTGAPSRSRSAVSGRRLRAYLSRPSRPRPISRAFRRISAPGVLEIAAAISARLRTPICSKIRFGLGHVLRRPTGIGS
jgi:hypothetical protein